MIKLDLSKVELSNVDINKKKLRIPTHLTPELAEFLGFHMGDGHMSINHNGKSTTYRIYSFSNLHKEIVYIDNYIVPLIQGLFNIRPVPIKYYRDSTYIIRINSKGIVTFLNTLGIPLGAKHSYGIPTIIKNNKEFFTPFLRGLADTDFCFTLKNKEGKLYPVISLGTASRKLAIDVSCCLKQLNINHYLGLDFVYEDPRLKSISIRHSVEINGIKNVKNWLEIIGFNNPSKLKVVNRAKNLEII
jgi:intein/homing endonuclease